MLSLLYSPYTLSCSFSGCSHTKIVDVPCSEPHGVSPSQRAHCGSTEQLMLRLNYIFRRFWPTLQEREHTKLPVAQDRDERSKSLEVEQPKQRTLHMTVPIQSLASLFGLRATQGLAPTHRPLRRKRTRTKRRPSPRLSDHPRKGIVMVLWSIKVNKDYFKILDLTNYSDNSVTEFIISGFPRLQRFSLLLFFIFMVIYLFTITGNGVIFFLINLDRKLQTPMYFFVSNLSFLDMSYTSVTIPKMLVKFSIGFEIISFTTCFTQMYLSVSLGAVECLLLSVMAYDRYIAICNPLHYHITMTRQLCILLALVAWIGGFACPVTMLVLALRLPFCGPNVIHHYYCDHPPILQLACADTSLNVMVGSSLSALVLSICFTLVVVSYIKIITAVLKISSSSGRFKAFSTCGSHFAVVNIFFLPLIFMYVRPTPSYSSDVDSLVAMFYTVLTPMMNPVIYSLRNKDIKYAFRNTMKC
ncbi:olfactory receptor 6N1-like [Pelobates fuscus]|uniref:olfactory receptor 6N1-like n=1 Tax=Pelobates fuscus TaxID=191477 RepID=UPI002FE4763E